MTTTRDATPVRGRPWTGRPLWLVGLVTALVAARLAGLENPSAREVVEALVAEALPTDRESRVFHQVWTSYAVMALTEPSMAAQPFVEGPGRLERRITRVLAEARVAGDPETEAARLLALAHGLGTSVLVGRRSPESAMGILHHHLDELAL